jgi:hypothetical protein
MFVSVMLAELKSEGCCNKPGGKRYLERRLSARRKRASKVDAGSYDIVDDDGRWMMMMKKKKGCWW